MPSLEALVPWVFSTPCISARGRAHLRSRVLPRLRVRPRLWVQGSPPTLIRRQDRCSSRGLTQRGRGSEKYQHRHWLVPARSAEGLLAHAQKAVGVAHQVDLVQVQVPADELDEGRGRAQRRLLGSGSILSLSASLGLGVELAAAGAKATAALQGRSGGPVALQKEVAAAMGIGVQLTSFSR